MNASIAEKQFPLLFSPCELGKRTARNRFAAQPMEGNDSEGGKVSERAIRRYKRLASGKWGIIVVEALSISADALARKNQFIINKENLPGYKRLVEEIKNVDPNTLVIFQVTHSGRKSGKEFSRPTALYNPGEGEHLLSAEEIGKIRQGLVNGVALAHEAGADGADFKLCHGYLGSEMLRPANIRDDEWGGSLENRMRFFKESFREIRERIGDRNFVLGSRISYYEGIRGGCGTASDRGLVEDFSEMDAIISEMDNLDLDYINVSAGIPGVSSEITRPTNSSKWFYLHQFRYAKRVKEMVKNMKVIGSAYSVLKEEALPLAEENISLGYTDFAGWGRQSLADPRFPAKILAGETPDYCTTCSGCSRLMVKQEEVGCIFFKPEASVQ
ncbi:hypothetical protein LJC14_05585 [Treponema sp. OttesenSCG-928-L16]|nr:hypothetical protein [Treponema sp. OttesenSCG-928-L16]